MSKMRSSDVNHNDDPQQRREDEEQKEDVVTTSSDKSQEKKEESEESVMEDTTTMITITYDSPIEEWWELPIVSLTTGGEEDTGSAKSKNKDGKEEIDLLKVKLSELMCDPIYSAAQLLYVNASTPPPSSPSSEENKSSEFDDLQKAYLLWKDILRSFFHYATRIMQEDNSSETQKHNLRLFSNQLLPQFIKSILTLDIITTAPSDPVTKVNNTKLPTVNISSSKNFLQQQQQQVSTNSPIYTDTDDLPPPSSPTNNDDDNAGSEVAAEPPLLRFVCTKIIPNNNSSPSNNISKQVELLFVSILFDFVEVCAKLLSLDHVIIDTKVWLETLILVFGKLDFNHAPNNNIDWVQLLFTSSSSDDGNNNSEGGDLSQQQKTQQAAQQQNHQQIQMPLFYHWVHPSNTYVKHDTEINKASAQSSTTPQEQLEQDTVLTLTRQILLDKNYKSEQVKKEEEEEVLNVIHPCPSTLDIASSVKLIPNLKGINKYILLMIQCFVRHGGLSTLLHLIPNNNTPEKITFMYLPILQTFGNLMFILMNLFWLVPEDADKGEIHQAFTWNYKQNMAYYLNNLRFPPSSSSDYNLVQDFNLLMEILDGLSARFSLRDFYQTRLELLWKFASSDQNCQSRNLGFMGILNIMEELMIRYQNQQHQDEMIRQQQQQQQQQQNDQQQSAEHIGEQQQQPTEQDTMLPREIPVLQQNDHALRQQPIQLPTRSTAVEETKSETQQQAINNPNKEIGDLLLKRSIVNMLPSSHYDTGYNNVNDGDSDNGSTNNEENKISGDENPQGKKDLHRLFVEQDQQQSIGNMFDIDDNVSTTVYCPESPNTVDEMEKVMYGDDYIANEIMGSEDDDEEEEEEDIQPSTAQQIQVTTDVEGVTSPPPSRSNNDTQTDNKGTVAVVEISREVQAIKNQIQSTIEFLHQQNIFGVIIKANCLKIVFLILNFLAYWDSIRCEDIQLVWSHLLQEISEETTASQQQSQQNTIGNNTSQTYENHMNHTNQNAPKMILLIKQIMIESYKHQNMEKLLYIGQLFSISEIESNLLNLLFQFSQMCCGIFYLPNENKDEEILPLGFDLIWEYAHISTKLQNMAISHLLTLATQMALPRQQQQQQQQGVNHNQNNNINSSNVMIDNSRISQSTNNDTENDITASTSDGVSHSMDGVDTAMMTPGSQSDDVAAAAAANKDRKKTTIVWKLAFHDQARSKQWLLERCIRGITSVGKSPNSVILCQSILTTLLRFMIRRAEVVENYLLSDLVVYELSRYHSNNKKKENMDKNDSQQEISEKEDIMKTGITMSDNNSSSTTLSFVSQIQSRLDFLKFLWEISFTSSSPYNFPNNNNNNKKISMNTRTPKIEENLTQQSSDNKEVINVNDESPTTNMTGTTTEQPVSVTAAAAQAPTVVSTAGQSTSETGEQEQNHLQQQQQKKRVRSPPNALAGLNKKLKIENSAGVDKSIPDEEDDKVGSIKRAFSFSSSPEDGDNSVTEVNPPPSNNNNHNNNNINKNNRNNGNMSGTMDGPIMIEDSDSDKEQEINNTQHTTNRAAGCKNNSNKKNPQEKEVIVVEEDDVQDVGGGGGGGVPSPLGVVEFSSSRSPHHHNDYDYYDHYNHQNYHPSEVEEVVVGGGGGGGDEDLMYHCQVLSMEHLNVLWNQLVNDGEFRVRELVYNIFHSILISSSNNEKHPQHHSQHHHHHNYHHQQQTQQTQQSHLYTKLAQSFSNYWCRSLSSSDEFLQNMSLQGLSFYAVSMTGSSPNSPPDPSSTTSRGDNNHENCKELLNFLDQNIDRDFFSSSTNSNNSKDEEMNPEPVQQQQEEGKELEQHLKMRCFLWKIAFRSYDNNVAKQAMMLFLLFFQNHSEENEMILLEIFYKILYKKSKNISSEELVRENNYNNNSHHNKRKRSDDDDDEIPQQHDENFIDNNKEEEQNKMNGGKKMKKDGDNQVNQKKINDFNRPISPQPSQRRQKQEPDISYRCLEFLYMFTERVMRRDSGKDVVIRQQHHHPNTNGGNYSLSECNKYYPLSHGSKHSSSVARSTNNNFVSSSSHQQTSQHPQPQNLVKSNNNNNNNNNNIARKSVRFVHENTNSAEKEKVSNTNADDIGVTPDNSSRVIVEMTTDPKYLDVFQVFLDTDKADQVWEMLQLLPSPSLDSHTLFSDSKNYYIILYDLEILEYLPKMEDEMNDYIPTLVEVILAGDDISSEICLKCVSKLLSFIQSFIPLETLDDKDFPIYILKLLVRDNIPANIHCTCLHLLSSLYKEESVLCPDDLISKALYKSLGGENHTQTHQTQQNLAFSVFSSLTEKYPFTFLRILVHMISTKGELIENNSNIFLLITIAIRQLLFVSTKEEEGGGGAGAGDPPQEIIPVHNHYSNNSTNKPPLTTLFLEKKNLQKDLLSLWHWTRSQIISITSSSGGAGGPPLVGAQHEEEEEEAKYHLPGLFQMTYTLPFVSTDTFFLELVFQFYVENLHVREDAQKLLTKLFQYHEDNKKSLYTCIKTFQIEDRPPRRWQYDPFLKTRRVGGSSNSLNNNYSLGRNGVGQQQQQNHQNNNNIIIQFAGLKNLGATCYLNSLLQQCFFIPSFRNAVFLGQEPQPQPLPQSDSTTTTSTSKEKKETQKKVKGAGGAALVSDSSDKKNENENQQTKLLVELKNLFARMLLSEVRTLDTSSLVGCITQYDGNPIRPSEQQDVVEFFNLFSDRLCPLQFGEATNTTTEKEKEGKENDCNKPTNVFSKIFGGELCNVVKCELCSRESRSSEQYLFLSVDVKGKNNLSDSLREFIRPEELCGDNQYFCDFCKSKQNSQKLCRIRLLPPTLIFHLKRFEFDFCRMRKIKLNDFYEFPVTMDMSEFSWGREFPTEYYQYKLSGVLVHSGTADSGHYYSLIRDRSSSLSDEWYCLNDSHVTKFDISQLPQTTFGGTHQRNTNNGAANKIISGDSLKVYSAYLLIYDRIGDYCEDEQEEKPDECKVEVSSSNSNEKKMVEAPQSKTKRQQQKEKQEELSNNNETDKIFRALAKAPSRSLIPRDITEEIEYENDDFAKDLIYYSVEYCTWMIELCHIETSLDMLQLLSNFLFSILVYGKQDQPFFYRDNKKPTGGVVDKLENLTSALCHWYNNSQEACYWFLGETEWVKKLLLDCPSPKIRQHYVRLVNVIYNKLIPMERPLYDKIDCEESESCSDSDEESEQFDMDDDLLVNKKRLYRISYWKSDSDLLRFIGCLLDNLVGCETHWRRFDQLFECLYLFASKGQAESLVLIRCGLILRLVDLYLGDSGGVPRKSLICSPNAVVEKRSNNNNEGGGKRHRMGDKYSRANMVPLIRILEILIRSGIAMPDPDDSDSDDESDSESEEDSSKDSNSSSSMKKKKKRPAKRQKRKRKNNISIQSEPPSLLYRGLTQRIELPRRDTNLVTTKKFFTVLFDESSLRTSDIMWFSNYGANYRLSQINGINTHRKRCNNIVRTIVHHLCYQNFEITALVAEVCKTFLEEKKADEFLLALDALLSLTEVQDEYKRKRTKMVVSKLIAGIHSNLKYDKESCTILRGIISYVPSLYSNIANKNFLEKYVSAWFTRRINANAEVRQCLVELLYTILMNTKPESEVEVKKLLLPFLYDFLNIVEETILSQTTSGGNSQQNNNVVDISTDNTLQLPQQQILSYDHNNNNNDSILSNYPFFNDDNTSTPPLLPSINNKNHNQLVEEDTASNNEQNKNGPAVAVAAAALLFNSPNNTNNTGGVNHHNTLNIPPKNNNTNNGGEHHTFPRANPHIVIPERNNTNTDTTLFALYFKCLRLCFTPGKSEDLKNVLFEYQKIHLQLLKILWRIDEEGRSESRSSRDICKGEIILLYHRIFELFQQETSTDLIMAEGESDSDSDTNNNNNNNNNHHRNKHNNSTKVDHISQFLEVYVTSIRENRAYNTRYMAYYYDILLLLVHACGDDIIRKRVYNHNNWKWSLRAFVLGESVFSECTDKSNLISEPITLCLLFHHLPEKEQSKFYRYISPCSYQNNEMSLPETIFEGTVGNLEVDVDFRHMIMSELISSTPTSSDCLLNKVYSNGTREINSLHMMYKALFWETQQTTNESNKVFLQKIVEDNSALSQLCSAVRKYHDAILSTDEITGTTSETKKQNNNNIVNLEDMESGTETTRINLVDECQTTKTRNDLSEDSSENLHEVFHKFAILEGLSLSLGSIVLILDSYDISQIRKFVESEDVFDELNCLCCQIATRTDLDEWKSILSANLINKKILLALECMKEELLKKSSKILNVLALTMNHASSNTADPRL